MTPTDLSEMAELICAPGFATDFYTVQTILQSIAKKAWDDGYIHADNGGDEKDNPFLKGGY